MTTSTQLHQGRPLRPLTSRNGGASAETTLVQWSDIEHPRRDNVDMPVPSHYSAAPSGDLCTTYKFSFVVSGENRTSVSISSDRPQPLRPQLLRASPSLSAVFGFPLVFSAVSSAMPSVRLTKVWSAALHFADGSPELQAFSEFGGVALESRARPASQALTLKCSTSAAEALELRMAACGAAAYGAAAYGSGAVAWSNANGASGEQMKHDDVDTERRRDEGKVRDARRPTIARISRALEQANEHSSHCWVRSRSVGHANLRNGLPRNSFFT